MTPQELKEKRIALHLSQQELAHRLGFSATHVSDIESGKTQIPPALMDLYEEVLVPEYTPSVAPLEIEGLRCSKGLTREELDAKLGFPSGYIRLFEIGRRYATPGMVEKIKKIKPKT